MNLIRKLFRISTIFKFLTVLCLLALSLSYLAPFVHPSTFWILPFLGLGYPIIMLCALFFLIVWAIARSRWFFYVLIIILVGGKLHFRTVSLTWSVEDSTNQNKFKILSYNVRLFDIYALKDENDHPNRDSIFSYLNKEQADVVCLQEFYYQDHIVGFPKIDTFETILDAKFMHKRMSFNPAFKNYFGIAMFSKFPMITKGQVDFDNLRNNTNNFCIFADIVKGKDTIRVYNTHLQSVKFQEDDYALFGDKAITGNQKSTLRILTNKLFQAYVQRAEQTKMVIEHMEQSPYEVLICGDFNDPPMSYTYNAFNAKFTDAYRNTSSGIGSTYAGKVPAGRIDYIFHSDKLHSNNFQIQNRVFSDHKAISCYIWKK